MGRNARLFILILILILIEYYCISSIKYFTKASRPSIKITLWSLYFLLNGLWLFIFFSLSSWRNIAPHYKVLSQVAIVFFLAFLLFKVWQAAFLFLDDIRRLFYLFIGFFQKEKSSSITTGMSRLKFLQYVASLGGGILFLGIFSGMRNRYNYLVRKEKIYFPNLPASFDGLRIIQISDIHSGSFTSPAQVKNGVELIMQQKADIIFFTGDLVNNEAKEMEGYIQIFNKLQAPLGVFSILGNHDYGDYKSWNSEAEKEKNLLYLKQIHRALGWRLLLNENITIEKNNEKIGIIGVENISNKGFPSYGNLAQAYEGSKDILFKILLSHDPSHWDHEVCKHFLDIDLTLSGHTHGFQMGVEIPGIKFSPAQFVYKQWSGLYQKAKQYLYVNRGFGYLFYAGRLGIRPEITLLTLQKSENA